MTPPKARCRRLQAQAAEKEAQYSREGIAEERRMLRQEVAAAHREKQRQEAIAAAAAAALQVRHRPCLLRRPFGCICSLLHLPLGRKQACLWC